MTSQKKGSFWAAVAAIVGCAACCALPFIATLGLGTLASAFLNRERLVGAAIALVLVGSAAAFWHLSRRSRGTTCTEQCAADRRCCK